MKRDPSVLGIVASVHVAPGGMGAAVAVVVNAVVRAAVASASASPERNPCMRRQNAAQVKCLR